MAGREAVPWPTKPGWYWWKDCDGHVDITHCTERDGNLEVFATKHHRCAEYDQYDTYIDREEFQEYGECEFAEVLDVCPFNPEQPIST